MKKYGGNLKMQRQYCNHLICFQSHGWEKNERKALWEFTQRDRNTCGRTWPSAVLSNTNHICTALGLNHGFQGARQRWTAWATAGPQTVQAIPVHDPRAPGGLGSQDSKTIGIWSWQGCQPYTAAAFTPKEDPWYSVLLAPKGFSQWKISKTHIGNWTRDLTACSAVPQPTAPHTVPYSKLEPKI